MRHWNIPARAPCFLVLLAVALHVGCAPTGTATRYSEPEPPKGIGTVAPDSILLFLSSLDSLHVYIHTFPTGLATTAPNLDPRDFCFPESLLAAYRTLAASRIPDLGRIGSPDRKYEILGEVESGVLQPLYRRRMHDDKLSGRGSHGKPYMALRNADWERAFNQLRLQGSHLGADALIEVFCGKGVSSFWYPPSTTSIPTIGPGGKIIGSYALTTPGGIGLTGWKLRALAVRWTGDRAS